MTAPSPPGLLPTAPPHPFAAGQSAAIMTIASRWQLPSPLAEPTAPVIITGAEAGGKNPTRFFTDFTKLGGKIEILED